MGTLKEGVYVSPAVSFVEPVVRRLFGLITIHKMVNGAPVLVGVLQGPTAEELFGQAKKEKTDDT